MARPEAADLESLARGGVPAAHTPWPPPLGPHARFTSRSPRRPPPCAASARRRSAACRLPGREIAHALAALVDDVNADRPASLHTAVYASLRQQANDAIAEGVRAGIDSLREALLPPGSDGRLSSSPEALSLVADVSAASLDAVLDNATDAAFDAFFDAAPDFGAEADGEPAQWLQPYASTLLARCGPSARRRGRRSRARSGVANVRRQRSLARQFDAAVEARVEERLEAAVAQRLAAVAGRQPTVAAPPRQPQQQQREELPSQQPQQPQQRQAGASEREHTMMATATAVSPHESASAAAAAAGHHHPYQEAMPMPMPATAPPPAGGAAPERKVELFASVAFLVLGNRCAAAPASRASSRRSRRCSRRGARALVRAVAARDAGDLSGRAAAAAACRRGRGGRYARVGARAKEFLGQVGKEAQAAASVTAELAAWRLPALPGLAPRAAYA